MRKEHFTGAQEKRKGYFETVTQGTIFLDEIGELPVGTQARLLRVLETGEFIKVGSSVVQKTDVRVLAATNVNLTRLIQQGKFREDLYYRLNTVPIHVPPLRERKEDIYLLFRKFSVDFGEKYRTPPISLDEEAKVLLTNHPWKGNIRELKNIAEQLSVLAKTRVVGSAELASYLPGSGENRLPVLSGSKDDFSERELLYKMLFDIKNDIIDLKKFMFRMSQGKMEFEPHSAHFEEPALPVLSNNGQGEPTIKAYEADISPVVISQDEHYEEESVEENLSIMEMEKELIIKALEKHRGKRKDAAFDLGISERTLYRKIKEYEISA